jgi:hypothetical protein
MKFIIKKVEGAAPMSHQPLTRAAARLPAVFLMFMAPASGEALNKR